MLVKVNHVDQDKVNLTKLDIDDYGSIIPLKELELRLPSGDNSIIQTLKSSPYAAIFTDGTDDENNSTIILASSITTTELNEEKRKIIEAIYDKKDKRENISM